MTDEPIVRDTLTAMLNRSNVSASELAAIWKTRESSVWESSPELYRQLAESAAGKADPLFVYDVASEGLRFLKGDERLRQLAGLALARSGALEAAMAA